VVLNHFA